MSDNQSLVEIVPNLETCVVRQLTNESIGTGIRQTERDVRRTNTQATLHRNDESVPGLYHRVRNDLHHTVDAEELDALAAGRELTVGVLVIVVTVPLKL